MGHSPKRGLHAIRYPLRQHFRPLVHRLIGDPYGGGGGRYRAAQKVDCFGFEHAALNHSSGCSATIVPPSLDTVAAVGPPTEYKDRFAQAMERAKVDEHAVAKELGITRQAVMKVLAGTTRALSAENNSVAAAYLKVSPDWLATGKGDMLGASTWPMSADLLEELRGLPPELQRKAENAARVALDMGTIAAPADPSRKRANGAS